MYDPSDGSVHLDLHAGVSGEGTILFTASHELVHYIRDRSPEKFSALANFLMERYGEQGVSVTTLIERQIDKAKQNDRTISFDTAYEEVIADSMESMLADGKVIERLAELKAKDKTLFERMREYFRLLAERVRAAYKGLKPDSREGRYVAVMMRETERLQALFTDALVEASESGQKNNAEGGVRYSESIGSRFNKATVEQALWEAFDHGDKGHDNLIRVSDMPNYIVEKFGIEGEVYIYRDHAYENMVSKEQAINDGRPIKRSGEDIHFHNLGIDKMTSALLSINNPTMVIETKTKVGNPAVIMILDEFGNNNAPLYAVLSFYSNREINGSFKTKPHIVLTVAERNFTEKGGGRVGYDELIRNAVNDGRVLDFNEKKRDDLSVIAKSAGLGNITKSSLEKSITHFRKEIKSFKEKNKILYSDRDREALEEQRKVNRLLQAQNDVLREDNRRLIEAVNIRNTVANGTRFTEGSVNAAAGKLMQIANARGDRSKLIALLHGYYEFIARGQGVTPEALRERSAPIVDWLMEHRRTQKDVDPETQELKGHLKSLRVSLSDVQMREVLALHDSYNEYRKGLFGAVRLAKDAETTLADVWGELSDLYPNYFDANTKEADMPDALAEAVSALKNSQMSDMLDMWEYDLIEQGLHQQVYESFWDVMTLRTYGEAKDRQMAELRREHKRQMDNLRKRRDEQIANIRAKAEAYAEASRKRAEQKAREAQEKYRQATKDWTAARERTELRRKAFKVYSELLTLLKDPTKQKHILPELQLAVAAALKVCDMDSVNAAERIERLRRQLATESEPSERDKIYQTIKRLEAASEKVAERLGALEKAYEKVKNNEATQAEAEAILNRIDVLKEVLGNVKFASMDNYQLRQLYEFYCMVRQSVRNSNRYFDEQRNTSISVESARARNEEITKGKKPATDEFGKPIARKLSWDNEKPFYAVLRVGNKVLTRLFEGLMKGESVYGVDMQEAKDTFRKIDQKYGYSKWNMKELVHLTSSDGRSFALTKGQLMKLYALYRRGESALRHLTQGGLTFREARRYKKTVDGKTVEYTVRHGDKFPMTEEQIVKAINENLTTEQKGFVEELQKYHSTELSAKGNEISRVLYGIDIFGEENYSPMHTVGEGHETKDAPVDLVKLREKGMTKKTDVNASNALYIDDFVEDWSAHCNEMALYHSMVLPIENFTRVMNYSENRRSFKNELEANYGKECTAYFDELLKQLNGGVRADSVELAYGKLLSMFKKGATMLSLSVVVQQRSAIARAYGEILPQYFGSKKVPRKSFKDTRDEMMRYAGCAVIKNMGGFDVGGGGASAAWLTEKEYNKGLDSVKGFFKDGNYRDNLLSRMPAWMDEKTWCAIWNAVKEEINDRRHDLKVGSKEYLEAVGERFTEVIGKTQVYDSVLSRSANMRSKSGLMKMMTAFMAEPTTTLNMFTEGVKMLGDKKTRVKGLRYCSSVIVGVVYNAALASIIYAMRDDDDDETYLEKYLSSFTSETLDSLSVFGYVPVLRDAWSLLQGWDVERSDMTLFSNAVDAIDKLISTYKEDDENNMGQILLGWWNVGTAVTDFFGLPLKNATRDVKAIFNTVQVAGTDLFGNRDTSLKALGDQMQAGVVALTPFANALDLGESKSDQLYDAMVAGDEEYLSRLRASYKSESALSSAIRKGIREKDARINEAAEAYISGDKRRYTELLDEIEGEGIFEREDIKAAAAAQVSELSPKEEEETEEKDEETSWYNTSDINAAYEGGDEDLAHEIIDDLIATKVANGTEEEKARSSVRSSMTRYWKPIYKAAYDSGNTEECERIEDILADSELYGRPKELRNTLKGWRKDDEEEE